MFSFVRSPTPGENVSNAETKAYGANHLTSDLNEIGSLHKMGSLDSSVRD